MSRSMDRFKLPHGDFPSIEELLSDTSTKPTNIGLIFRKYIPWRQSRDGGEEAKIDRFMSLLHLNSKKIPNDRLPLQNYYNYYLRFKSMLKRLTEQGYCVPNPPIVAHLGWRLAINLGEESVYETSISFHRNYSIPIIPGSAVKGCARAAAFFEAKRDQIPEHEVQSLMKTYKLSKEDAYRCLQNSESLGEASEKLEVFGSQDLAGKVIFFDALPIIPKNSKSFIRLDVMNVHYRDYYGDASGNVPPGDWMNPNPIFFPVVEDIDYEFNVASVERKRLVELAVNFVKTGITNVGIGAKTAAGYGYFVLNKSKA